MNALMHTDQAVERACISPWAADDRTCRGALGREVVSL